MALKQKTEPFQWKNSQGLMTQAMLREYLRWILPQLGRRYEPPDGVKDYTAAATSRFQGKQPEPFRPRASTGPVFRSDLRKFADYCFEALTPYSDRNPYLIPGGCILIFVPEFKKLHAHLLDLIRMQRAAS